MVDFACGARPGEQLSAASCLTANAGFVGHTVRLVRDSPWDAVGRRGCVGVAQPLSGRVAIVGWLETTSMRCISSGGVYMYTL
ncbi:unannotated protein [freshwater metagenome]|uniref:Unannotated protein n=1 Tax=freshwater metagenome TaxID=449393 RepID=A0A6J7FDV2_9ZZZZ